MSQINLIHTPGCPPPPHPPMTDQQVLRFFESHLPSRKAKMKINQRQICNLKYNLMSLVNSHEDMKAQEQSLMINCNLSDEELNHAMESIHTNRNIIERTCVTFNETYIKATRRLIARRLAKRRRLKRRREDYKKYRKELIKQREENSRRINENLQKIQEDIRKDKEAEEAKKQADTVLKDVLRRKADAKKSIAKLDALMELRRARLNTARGEGQVIPENNAFNTQIEKLKALWIYKLSSYEVEEEQLRAKLQVAQQDESTTAQASVKSNLDGWLKFMFGCCEFPQYDFKGDIQKFIEVRRGWDQFIDKGPEATPMPVGWVLPNFN